MHKRYSPSPAVLAVAIGSIIALAVGTDVASGPLNAAPRKSVSREGFTLRSTSVDLPYDEQPYPDGPGAEVMNANCAGCHSASMVLLQPKLSRGQWEGIVRKMRDVYRAPVAAEDVPAIVGYLEKLQPR